MTLAAARMIAAVRREALAWILAGLALHWVWKNGFTRWALTALAMALGAGMTIRKPKPPVLPTPD